MTERCSFTWIERDKKNNTPQKNHCDEKIWEGSNEYCIFHDPMINKDQILFHSCLKKRLKEENYNFIGFVFPDSDFSFIKFTGDVSFYRAVFNKEVSFTRAVFQYNVNFSRVTFKESVNFNRSLFKKKAIFNGAIFHEFSSVGEARFIEKANFTGCIFHKGVRFRRTVFHDIAEFLQSTIYNEGNFINARFTKDAFFNGAILEDAYFVGTSFRNVDFEGAIIKRVFDFRPGVRIRELNLQDIQIRLKGRITADLRKTRFNRSDLENVDFISCRWPENGKIFEEENMNNLKLTFREIEGIYRNLKQNMQRHGNGLRAGKFFYREMEMRRRGASSKKMRAWHEIYRMVAGYGEKPQNTIIMASIIVFIFAALYGGLHCLQYPPNNLSLMDEVVDCIYFSFVTFTTLGLGDIYPLTSLGKVLICCEAMAGAFLIALFVAIFVRKITQ
jgi:uncharacterized protein YjbI with pentapeptide repeats